MKQEARYCLQGFALEVSACPAMALHAIGWWFRFFRRCLITVRRLQFNESCTAVQTRFAIIPDVPIGIIEIDRHRHVTGDTSPTQRPLKTVFASTDMRIN
ncbi:hypothetical protein [Acidovorax sp. NCPPB 4044]|uniref:hypothetical protein n=1 Tax=Acidovorax sp. NCPPB 4044 TaxID=2940490 RepID=UPI0023045C61|nr:hypothetical protein [Acidovorax sp. NCPPB 4044]MDA8521314.1 hypothetical protein [Acidovorax sp. NCPPB 4044]